MAEFASHVGDIGTEFIVLFQTLDCNGLVTALDLSTASAITLCFRKPDQTTLVEHAAVVTPVPCGVGDGSDGKASYVTLSGDLDVPGVWTIAGKAVFPGGETYRSNEATFTVRTPICS